MLQTVENRIAMPPEIAIEAENYRFIQRLNRTVMDECWNNETGKST